MVRESKQDKEAMEGKEDGKEEEEASEENEVEDENEVECLSGGFSLFSSSFVCSVEKAKQEETESGIVGVSLIVFLFSCFNCCIWLNAVIKPIWMFSSFSHESHSWENPDHLIRYSMEEQTERRERRGASKLTRRFRLLTGLDEANLLTLPFVWLERVRLSRMASTSNWSSESQVKEQGTETDKEPQTELDKEGETGEGISEPVILLVLLLFVLFSWAESEEKSNSNNEEEEKERVEEEEGRDKGKSGRKERTEEERGTDINCKNGERGKQGASEIYDQDSYSDNTTTILLSSIC